MSKMALSPSLALITTAIAVSLGVPAPSAFARACGDASGAPTVNTSAAALRDAIVILGIARVSDVWRVVLKDLRTGATRTVAQYGAAFELTVDEVLTDAVFLSVGQYSLFARLGSLTPSEATAARERMRDYWRLQWEGPWGRAISTSMTSTEQEALREVVLGYWR